MATDRVILQCLGDVHNPNHVFLDGRTGDGTVGLAPSTNAPFSGTVWEQQEISPGVFTLKCLGQIHNPDHVFLDGRTGDGTVGLAPSTDAPFSGTRWRIQIASQPIDDGPVLIPVDE